MDEIKVTREFVSAETARIWLRNNIENNRRVSEDRVSQYARDMKENRWQENGDTVKFSKEGKLIDGQHRLAACVESGIGFWTQVARGVTEDAFMTIDRNQSRSVGQLLHLCNGVTDYNHLGGAITWLSRFRDGIMLSHYRPTAPESLELLEKNPGLPDSVRTAASINHRFKAGSTALVAVCHYLFTRQDADLAERFFASLSTGANLRQIDPVFKLRERIISASGSATKRIGTYELFALYFKTWQAEKEKRTLNPTTVLRWYAGESFPNIGPIGSAKTRKPLVVPVKSGRKNAKRQAKPTVDLGKLVSKPLSLDHPNLKRAALVK